MKRLVLAVLLCSIPSLVLAQASKEDAAKAALHETKQQFREAMEALDAKAVALTYADDAVMGEAGQDEPVKGRAAIQASYQAMFDAAKAISITDWVEESTFRGTFITSVGHCTVTMTMKDGSISVMRVDFTDVCQPDSTGRWLYVNDFAAFTPIEDAGGE